MRYLVAFMYLLALLASCTTTKETVEVPSTNKEVTQCGNMINGGRVLQGAGNEFYYHFYEQQNNTLTLMEYNAGDSEPIISDIGTCYFYRDGWIYCGSGPEQAFTRVNTTTGEKETLLDKTCLEAIEYDGKVYFTTAQDSNLFSMDLDGKNINQVGNYSFVHNLMVSDGKLYCYIVCEGIYSLNSDSGLDLELPCGEIQIFYILNDTAYYLFSHGQQLYMYPLGLENAQPSLIDDRYIFDLNVRNDELIYIALAADSHAKTFSYNTRSGEISCLSNYGYDGIFIANNMIFEYVTSRGIYCIEEDKYLSE